MRIVFITPVVPFIDGGTSAHIYHLMLERDKDIIIDIYTFNNNNRTTAEIENVEKELNVKFHLIKMPRWIRWMFKLRLHFIRVFLRYPIYYYLKVDKGTVREINSIYPDGIWIYGEELASITRQFPQFRRVHTLPDSEAMYFYRMLQQRFVTKDKISYWKNVLMYRKYVRMEKNYDNNSSVTYHLVGQADVDFIKNNNPGIDARFIRHPHYHVLNAQREIKFHQPKIRLLIAGRYDLYMKQEADELNSQLVMHNEQLKEHYAMTFLGKGWEKHVEILRKVGYEVNLIKFADNYQEELVKHDIQITPITVGTGTKGKVLDGIANGLLVIGTRYALENIKVINGESCLEYKNPEEVLDYLLDIVYHTKVYEKKAEAGRDAIFKYHNRRVVSNKLFSLFK